MLVKSPNKYTIIDCYSNKQLYYLKISTKTWKSITFSKYAHLKIFLKQANITVTTLPSYTTNSNEFLELSINHNFFKLFETVNLEQNSSTICFWIPMGDYSQTLSALFLEQTYNIEFENLKSANLTTKFLKSFLLKTYIKQRQNYLRTISKYNNFIDYSFMSNIRYFANRKHVNTYPQITSSNKFEYLIQLMHHKSSSDLVDNLKKTLNSETQLLLQLDLVNELIYFQKFMNFHNNWQSLLKTYVLTDRVKLLSSLNKSTDILTLLSWVPLNKKSKYTAKITDKSTVLLFSKLHLTHGLELARNSKYFFKKLKSKDNLFSPKVTNMYNFYHNYLNLYFTERDLSVFHKYMFCGEMFAIFDKLTLKDSSVIFSFNSIYKLKKEIYYPIYISYYLEFYWNIYNIKNFHNFFLSNNSNYSVLFQTVNNLLNFSQKNLQTNEVLIECDENLNDIIFTDIVQISELAFYHKFFPNYLNKPQKYGICVEIFNNDLVIYYANSFLNDILFGKLFINEIERHYFYLTPKWLYLVFTHITPNLLYDFNQNVNSGYFVECFNSVIEEVTICEFAIEDFVLDLREIGRENTFDIQLKNFDTNNLFLLKFISQTLDYDDSVIINNQSILDSALKQYQLEDIRLQNNISNKIYIDKAGIPKNEYVQIYNFVKDSLRSVDSLSMSQLFFNFNTRFNLLFRRNNFWKKEILLKIYPFSDEPLYEIYRNKIYNNIFYDVENRNFFDNWNKIRNIMDSELLVEDEIFKNNYNIKNVNFNFKHIWKNFDALIISRSSSDNIYFSENFINGFDGEEIDENMFNSIPFEYIENGSVNDMYDKNENFEVGGLGIGDFEDENIEDLDYEQFVDVDSTDYSDILVNYPTFGTSLAATTIASQISWNSSLIKNIDVIDQYISKLDILENEDYNEDLHPFCDFFEYSDHNEHAYKKINNLYDYFCFYEEEHSSVLNWDFEDFNYVFEDLVFNQDNDIELVEGLFSEDLKTVPKSVQHWKMLINTEFPEEVVRDNFWLDIIDDEITEKWQVLNYYEASQLGFEERNIYYADVLLTHATDFLIRDDEIFFKDPSELYPAEVRYLCFGDFFDKHLADDSSSLEFFNGDVLLEYPTYTYITDNVNIDHKLFIYGDYDEDDFETFAFRRNQYAIKAHKHEKYCLLFSHFYQFYTIKFSKDVFDLYYEDSFTMGEDFVNSELIDDFVESEESFDEEWDYHLLSEEEFLFKYQTECTYIFGEEDRFDAPLSEPKDMFDFTSFTDDSSSKKKFNNFGFNSFGFNEFDFNDSDFNGFESSEFYLADEYNDTFDSSTVTKNTNVFSTVYITYLTMAEKFLFAFLYKTSRFLRDLDVWDFVYGCDFTSKFLEFTEEELLIEERRQEKESIDLFLGSVYLKQVEKSFLSESQIADTEEYIRHEVIMPHVMTTLQNATPSHNPKPDRIYEEDGVVIDGVLRFFEPAKVIHRILDPVTGMFRDAGPDEGILKINTLKNNTSKDNNLKCETSKNVTSQIDENSGNGNSGNGNSGNGNSGNDDSGNDDSGNGDSGNGNSGNGDSGNGDSGNGDSGNGDSGNGDSGSEASGSEASGSEASGNENSDNEDPDSGNFAVENSNDKNGVGLNNIEIQSEKSNNKNLSCNSNSNNDLDSNNSEKNSNDTDSNDNDSDDSDSDDSDSDDNDSDDNDSDDNDSDEENDSDDNDSDEENDSDEDDSDEDDSDEDDSDEEDGSDEDDSDDDDSYDDLNDFIYKLSNKTKVYSFLEFSQKFDEEDAKFSLDEEDTDYSTLINTRILRKIFNDLNTDLLNTFSKIEQNWFNSNLVDTDAVYGLIDEIDFDEFDYIDSLNSENILFEERIVSDVLKINAINDFYSFYYFNEQDPLHNTFFLNTKVLEKVIIEFSYKKFLKIKSLELDIYEQFLDSNIDFLTAFYWIDPHGIPMTEGDNLNLFDNDWDIEEDIEENFDELVDDIDSSDIDNVDHDTTESIVESIALDLSTKPLLQNIDTFFDSTLNNLTSKKSIENMGDDLCENIIDETVGEFSEEVNTSEMGFDTASMLSDDHWTSLNLLDNTDCDFSEHFNSDSTDGYSDEELWDLDSEQVKKYFLNFCDRRLSTYRDGRFVHWKFFTHKTLKERRYKLYLKANIQVHFLNKKVSEIPYHYYLLNFKIQLPWQFWKSLFKHLNAIFNIYEFTKYTIYQLPLNINILSHLTQFKKKQIKWIARGSEWSRRNFTKSQRFWMTPKQKIPKFFTQLVTDHRAFDYFVQFDYMTLSFVILKESYIHFNYRGPGTIIDNNLLKILNFRYKA